MEATSSIPTDMLKHIQMYEISGKGLKVYCKEAGISFSRMQYLYYKKYKKGASVEPLTGFTEVISPILPVNGSNYTVEVKLPNGTQIIFNKNISVEQLKAFL